MKADNFVQLVTDMRAAQKHYFKQRTKSNMLASMEIEKQVDQALVEGIEIPGQPEQLDMFATANKQGDTS